MRFLGFLLPSKLSHPHIKDENDKEINRLDDSSLLLKQRQVVVWRIQIQCQTQWGLLSKIMQLLSQRLGLQIVDYRTWNQNSKSNNIRNTIMVNEIFCQDSLIVNGDTVTVDKLQKRRICEIYNALNDVIYQPANTSSIQIQQYHLDGEAKKRASKNEDSNLSEVKATTEKFPSPDGSSSTSTFETTRNEDDFLGENPYDLKLPGSHGHQAELVVNGKTYKVRISDENLDRLQRLNDDHTIRRSSGVVIHPDESFHVTKNICGYFRTATKNSEK